MTYKFSLIILIQLCKRIVVCSMFYIDWITIRGPWSSVRFRYTFLLVHYSHISNIALTIIPAGLTYVLPLFHVVSRLSCFFASGLNGKSYVCCVIGLLNIQFMKIQFSVLFFPLVKKGD